MNNLLNDTDKKALVARLHQLSPRHIRKWGSMSAQQVIPHMTDPLRCATGDRPAPLMPSMFSKFPVKYLAVWVMPWPKAAPTAPEFIQGNKGTPPEEFERDKHALLLAIHQFCTHAKNRKFHDSPVFGKLSNRAWGRLMWRHLDHHLRQFGV